MFTRCHNVARTPPAFFSLELRRPLRSISTASALRPRSARPRATELPTTPAPMTTTSNRSPATMKGFYQSRVVEDRAHLMAVHFLEVLGKDWRLLYVFRETCPLASRFSIRNHISTQSVQQ